MELTQLIAPVTRARSLGGSPSLILPFRITGYFHFEWWVTALGIIALGLTKGLCVRIVCVPTRPCARFNAPVIPLDVYLLSDNIGWHVRDFVQAQGFLSPQPISGAPATFWSCPLLLLCTFFFIFGTVTWWNFQKKMKWNETFRVTYN